MEQTSYIIVVKLGTSSIVDEQTMEPRLANLSRIVETLVKLRRQGHRIIIVSSGAIAIGMKTMGLSSKPARLSEVQALASIGQSRLIGLFDTLFRQFDQRIAQILFTRNDIQDFTQYKNAINTLQQLMLMGVIPIVNENDTLSISEIKFGDNDTLSAITAGMVHADYLFLMTDVPCLYTDNPRSNPDAQAVLLVEKMEDLDIKSDSKAGAGSKVGTGGMTTKLIAAELATNVGVHTIITLSTQPNYILDIVNNIVEMDKLKLTLEEQTEFVDRAIKDGKIPLHTRFLGLPRQTKIISDKRFWLLHGNKTRGALIIDQGCFEALTRKNRAGLLPVGIVGVEGNFHDSESVSLKVVPRKDSDLSEAVLVGNCRVNYSSNEIELIMGKHSHEIESILGFADSEYVAHRDNIAFPPFAPSTDSLA